MKTELLLAAAAFAVCVPMATAQTGPSLGVRASMELTAPSGGGDYYKLGAGVTVGVVADLPLYRRVYFEPGVLFTYSAMTAKDLVTFNDEYYYQGAANLYGIRVPLNFGYDFDLTDNLSMSVATGPWLNFNVSARQKLLPNFAAPDPLPNRTINLFDHGWKRVDAQWGFSLNFRFAQSYYVGITGGVAFTPLASFGNKDKKIRIHRNTVAISLGYNF